jgi:hypothetical protein
MPVSKPTLIAAILLMLAVVLAVQFNPTPQMHRAKIREVLSDRSPLVRALGLGSLAAFASSYHSVGVGSYTKVGDRTISIGAYGVVRVLDLGEDRKRD